MGRSAVRVRSSALCQDAHPWCWVAVAVLARCYPKSIMTETTHDPRVDAYIESLPDWQQGICRRVRALVHAADPEVTETIKRTNRPYFVLHGNVCALLAAKDHVNVFLYDPLVPDPEGIITSGHENKTGRTAAIYRGGRSTRRRSSLCFGPSLRITGPAAGVRSCASIDPRSRPELRRN